MLAGAMPTAQAFLAALGRTNLIQMLAAGGGVSGRQFGSIRSLKKLRSSYGDDMDGGARRMMANVLGPYAGKHLAEPPVFYARLQRAARRDGYPEFRRDVTIMQAFIDLVAHHTPRAAESNPRTSRRQPRRAAHAFARPGRTVPCELGRRSR